MQPKKISYSGIRQFCNCRRAYKYHYVDNLVPKKDADALIVGGAWHKLLEQYYTTKNPIDTTFYKSLKCSSTLQLESMLKGYHDKYFIRMAGDKDFKILGIELPFEIKIKPPHKGRAARGVRFRGVIDMVVEIDGNIWIVEHKTTKCIDGKYLDRLWHDLQIMLYAYAYQETTGKKVAGIIYNVVQKTGIKPGKGETEQEYKKRYAELCAKSKSGKSNAKRKIPESDDDFKARLIEIYKNPNMYHREGILCDDKRIEEVKQELWDTYKEMKSTNYYKNRSQCFVYGECQYFKICNSGENPIVIENFYKTREIT